jgi:hypothetical protein
MDLILFMVHLKRGKEEIVQALPQNSNESFVVCLYAYRI